MQSTSVTTLKSESIWRRLLACGVALGSLAGMLEACWTYFLPVVFPSRVYPMPSNGLMQFIFVAVLTDVFLGLLGAVALGLVFTGIRKVFRRKSAFRRWPFMIYATTIAGVFLYLYVSYFTVYHWFGTASGVVGFILRYLGLGFAIILAAALIVGWALEVGRKRLTKAMPTIAWSAAVVLVFIVTAVRYVSVKVETPLRENLPIAESDYRPNVFLVTLDTTRADYLGPYGHPIVKTPTIDRLAQDAIVFDNAFAQAPTTTPSHCSIMTSTYPCVHRAVNGSAMRTNLPTLAEIFSANGYATAAFVASAMVRSANTGLHRGFDYYEDSLSRYFPFLRNDDLQYVSACYLLTWLMGANEIRGDVPTERCIAWLDDASDSEPWFLWLHYIDPHGPYDAPEPYKRMYDGKIDADHPAGLDRARYGGEITYTDMLLGQVIDTLKRKGFYDDLLIIVTADHGQAIGEKHASETAFGHSYFLYDSTQRVPLLVKLPGQKNAGTRVQDLVQLIDIAPTVVEMLDIRPPESFQGVSFMDLLEGNARKESQVAYGECVHLPLIGEDVSANSRRFLMTVRTPVLRYLCNDDRSREELFDLVSDPGETTNVVAGKRELVDSLFAMLKETLVEWVDDESDNGQKTIRPSVKSQLKSLGYLGTGEEE